MASAEEGTLVLVTGVTGYIAGHVVKILQTEGYRVRGTVRSLANEDKIKWLKEICPNAKYELQLVEADLLKEDTWPSAVKDCAFVIHVASPFPGHVPSNPEEDLYKPAVEGTKNVLKACVASGSVRKVVITSSILAVHGEMTYEEGKIYAEDDWSDLDSASLDPYSRSKTMAEKAAWDYVNGLKDEGALELAVINPGMVLGPVLGKNPGTSVDVVRRMMDRGMPAVPKVNFPVCDVRDVAVAHYKAMITPDSSGHRHLIISDSMWLKEIAQVLSKEFKQHGYGISTIGCPYFALWVTGIFDKGAKMLLPRVGKEIKYDNARMKDVLGITPTETRTTIIDTGYSLIETGIVKKSKKLRNQKTSCDEDAAGASENRDELAVEKQNGEVSKEDEEGGGGGVVDKEGDEVHKPEKLNEIIDDQDPADLKKEMKEIVEEKKEVEPVSDSADK